MGEIAIPLKGKVYLDANCFIYSVERIDPYRAILDMFWHAVSHSQIQILTSELTLLEVLVKPLKDGDITTAGIFRTVLRHSPDVQMLPITQNILEEATRLRATLGVKTPDALHAATALVHHCGLFVTNDKDLRKIAELNIIVLSELVGTTEPFRLVFVEPTL